MGLGHGEEAQPQEVGIGPALIVVSTCDTASSLSGAQDAPHSATDPSVQRLEHPMPRVLEVLEPPTEHLVEFGDDLPQRVSVGSSRSLADFVFELVYTLLA